MGGTSNNDGRTDRQKDKNYKQKRQNGWTEEKKYNTRKTAKKERKNKQTDRKRNRKRQREKEKKIGIGVSLITSDT